jgi:S-adenosyl-L-methionine hydrolase (adenosine-forming)
LPGFITLTTDFGLSDPFVGVMKGVIYSIHPEVTVVDLSHQLKSFDVLEGALLLAESYPYFPPDAIHVVVVDPGVGSERRPILASTSQGHFIGPDNGVFTVVYDREPSVCVRAITAERFFRKPVSQTFHGRDIFAPVAAWLSRGMPPETLGPEVSDYFRLPITKPQRAAGKLQGAVLRIDKFGNVITNFRQSDLPAGRRFRVVLNERPVTRLISSYEAGESGEIFLIVGSSGLVEIAARQASAAEALTVRRGDAVVLELE